MAINKMREQYYTNFGGINEKSSVYTTGLQQFLNLRNYDGFVPNALTKRPGTTTVIDGPIGNTFFLGFTNVAPTLIYGTTFAPVTALGHFVKNDGSSYLVAGIDNFGPVSLFKFTVGGVAEIITGTTVGTHGASAPKYDFSTFNDWFFAVNGTTAMKWDGDSLIPVGLPVQTGNPNDGVTGISSGFFLAVAYKYAYLSSNGNQGPVSDLVVTIDNTSTGGVSHVFLRGFSIIPGFGITAVVFYRADGPTLADLLTDNTFNLVGYANAGTATFVDSFGNTSLLGNPEPSYQTSRVGLSLDDVGTFLGNSLIPRYVESGENRTFWAGFSNTPSSFIWSDIDIAEQILPENIAEVRSDDGDVITGLKYFQGELTVFKKRSFHRFIGDSNENFTLKQVSAEYGALSNNAIVEFENTLLFLDEKGIVQFNGSDYRVISQPVEDTFRRINLDVSDCAVGVHYPFRNQVWFGIPVDGSTTNNLTVVYDYLLNAWFIHDGFAPASFAKIKSSLDSPTVWYGGYSSNIEFFGQSFFSDDGTGFTNVIETRFMSPDGANVTNMFRQFFLDVNTQSGTTGVVDVEVFTDYDRSTVQATFSVFMDQFQTRTDFGVAGKSVAFKMYFNNISLPAQINGWTVRRRYLRSV